MLNDKEKPSELKNKFITKEDKPITDEDLPTYFQEKNQSIIFAHNERLHEKTDFYLKNLEFRRWFILLSYVLLNFLNGFAWATYSPIIDDATEYYSVDSSQVIWFVYQYYILYIIFSFPGSYCLGKSLSLSLKVGSFINALGAWIKYLAFKNYMYALVGQCLIALSSNLIMAAPNNVANAWFHAKERFFAVTFGVFSNTFGTGVGYLVSPLIVADNSENITELNLVSAILLTVPFILCMVCFKEKPKFSPNLSNSMPKAAFFSSVKLLIKNKKYVMTALSYGICFSNCWSILSIIDLFLQREHISSFLVGLLGLMLIVAGLISSFTSTLFLRYVSESRKYFDPIIKILYALTMISLLLISIIIPIGDYLPILIIGLIVLGLGCLGLQPFECEALEEISFPVQESISVNGMFFVACSFGFALSFISTLDAFGNYGLWALSISMFPFTIYVLGFYKTDFKKSNREGHFSSFNERTPLTFEEDQEPIQINPTGVNENEGNPTVNNADLETKRNSN